ncbi:MAG: sporulation protein SpoIID, partial [Desulfitobacterium hafniense]
MLPLSDRLSFSVKKVFFFLMVSLALQAAPCQAKEIDVELVWKFKDAGWIKVEVEQGNYTLKEAGKDKQTAMPFPAGSN